MRLCVLAGMLSIVSGCTGAQNPPTIAISYDAGWQRERLFAVAIEMREVFVREGAEGLLRLRLHDEELEPLFTPETVERTRRTNSGLAPTSDERRWQTFLALAGTPIIGFCARGVRVVNPGTVDGVRTQVLMVDRLLIVGQDGGERWGSWLEGLILTGSGWRLLPTSTFARQVEQPRRSHADLTLWTCDLSEIRSGTSPQ